MINQLKHFTQTSTLQAIGERRLTKFLAAFDDDLKAADIVLPTLGSENGNYFGVLGAALASADQLPARLRQTLFTLENAAAPENQALLDAAIQQRIPCVSLNGCCPLDCALELWFLAPDSLAPFAPPSQTSEVGDQRSQVHQPSEPAAPGQSPSPSAPAPPFCTLHSPFCISSASSIPTSDLRPPTSASALLDELAQIPQRFVVLPKWGAEACALWSLHTYAYHLRDVSTYLGIESPEKRCGKTTLLTVLGALANRAVTASNISPPAFFRVIEDMSPALLIDEADTFLRGNEPLKGILNAGYTRKTAFVLRVGPAAPNSNPDEDAGAAAPAGVVNRFSCWCPKVIAQIGRLPDTLADRCIIIRMQRKTATERCERLRNLDPTALKLQCAQFVSDHAEEIANASPDLPAGLSDRAADIWEPLIVLADLAGGHWPETARQAALALSASAQESNPIGALLLDLFLLFEQAKADRLFSRTLVSGLGNFPDRPWTELTNGKAITERWLAHQLRPYGIKPRSLRIGDTIAKGYLLEDCSEAFRRYIPKSELDALLADSREANTPPVPPSPNKPPSPGQSQS